jgi:CRP/FNR family transcriptional regulator, anaerobic regulatory protein
METIRNFVRIFNPNISDLKLDYFASKCSRKIIKKNRFLLQKGQLSLELVIVKKGSFKIFYELDDRQINVQFAFEQMLVTEMQSFITQKPSKFSIQALEDSEIYVISHDDLKVLYNQFSEIRQFGFKMTEMILAECIERLTSFQFEETSARYSRICQDFNYMNRVSLKDLASFLGITPNSLSRLRRLNP